MRSHKQSYILHVYRKLTFVYQVHFSKKTSRRCTPGRYDCRFSLLIHLAVIHVLRIRPSLQPVIVLRTVLVHLLALAVMAGLTDVDDLIIELTVLITGISSGKSGDQLNY